jgi:hypothetical protein
MTQDSTDLAHLMFVQDVQVDTAKAPALLKTFDPSDSRRGSDDDGTLDRGGREHFAADRRFLMIIQVIDVIAFVEQVGSLLARDARDVALVDKDDLLISSSVKDKGFVGIVKLTGNPPQELTFPNTWGPSHDNWPKRTYYQEMERKGMQTVPTADLVIDDLANVFPDLGVAAALYESRDFPVVGLVVIQRRNLLGVRFLIALFTGLGGS